MHMLRDYWLTSFAYISIPPYLNLNPFYLDINRIEISTENQLKRTIMNNEKTKII